MERVCHNPLNQLDMYLDVTISIRNIHIKALTAYSLEREQIIETFFPKEFDK